MNRIDVAIALWTRFRISTSCSARSRNSATWTTESRLAVLPFSAKAEDHMQPTQTAAHLPGDLLDRLARGEVILAEVFGLDQDSLYKTANIGSGLLSSGKLSEAKQIYAGLVAADPYDSVFHCHLAAVH